MTESFMGIVCGFADTLPAFKEILPGLVNYNQSSIVPHVLGADYYAHKTVHDATSPQNVTGSNKTKVKATLLPKHSFVSSTVLQKLERDRHQEANIASLQPLVNARAFGEAMACKIAASGLTMKHLQLAYSRWGTDGTQDQWPLLLS